MFNAKKTQSWIPKSKKVFVEAVEEDSEVVEVLLKKGFYTSANAETVWVYSKERYELGECTLSEIRDDLKQWLSDVIAAEVCAL